MYLEYETPVWSLVMIWSTPSSRYAHVVARSALGGGIGYWVFPVAMSYVVTDQHVRRETETRGGRREEDKVVEGQAPLERFGFACCPMLPQVSGASDAYIRLILANARATSISRL